MSHCAWTWASSAETTAKLFSRQSQSARNVTPPTVVQVKRVLTQTMRAGAMTKAPKPPKPVKPSKAAPKPSKAAPRPSKAAPKPSTLAPKPSTLAPKPIEILPPSRSGRKRKAKEFFGDGGEQDGAASKFKSATLSASKPFVSAEEESIIPDYAHVGATILAVGFQGGQHKLFKSTVIGHRVKFPRIVVEFLSDPATGSTSSLVLPSPDTAYVHAGMIQAIDALHTSNSSKRVRA